VPRFKWETRNPNFFPMYSNYTCKSTYMMADNFLHYLDHKHKILKVWKKFIWFFKILFLGFICKGKIIEKILHFQWPCWWKPSWQRAPYGRTKGHYHGAIYQNGFHENQMDLHNFKSHPWSAFLNEKKIQKNQARFFKP
jgi:hypothetical protein